MVYSNMGATESDTPWEIGLEFCQNWVSNWWNDAIVVVVVKVCLKSGQEQLIYWWHWVCGGGGGCGIKWFWYQPQLLSWVVVEFGLWQ